MHVYILHFPGMNRNEFTAPESPIAIETKPDVSLEESKSPKNENLEDEDWIPKNNKSISGMK